MLAFISRKDGLKQTELANELDVGKVALGALIDRLETAGFVVRKPQPDDRRVKRVFLTKKVDVFMKRLRRETDAFNARIIEGIPRADLERTSNALLAMKGNLLAMAGNGEFAESWRTRLGGSAGTAQTQEGGPLSARRPTP